MNDFSNSTGLADAAQVEALAEHLTRLADALHARVMRAIKKLPAPPGNTLVITLSQAQTLYEDEVALRQRANRLYADAARYAVVGLPLPQHTLLALASAAGEAIRAVNHTKELIDISATLLALATAALTARPDPFLNAYVKLEKQVAALDLDQAAALP